VAHHRAFPVAGIILGAGAGTRFGEPKAGARLEDGRRFLDAVCTTARDAGLDPLVAVVPPGMAAPDGVTVVVNPRPEGEQVASLRLALAQLANADSVGAVVWPVDHPFVSLESVLAVVDAARRTGAPVVRPQLEGAHGHPVFFHRDTWRELMTVADGGARAVVHAYGARVAAVAVRDRGVLRDIDHPNDLSSGSMPGPPA
jgi:CTP:molybdopterin cytidylyltransferase MocA